MRISAYCYTNQGGREHNEDSVRCSAEAGAFVLADGLGGHGKGEVASALAADVLFEGCAAHPGPEELVKGPAPALQPPGAVQEEHIGPLGPDGLHAREV